MSKNTSTNARSDKCLLTEIKWVSKGSEFSAKEKSDCCGELCRRISLSNGDSEIEASGECGYEITPTSFNDKGWE